MFIILHRFKNSILQHTNNYTTAVLKIILLQNHLTTLPLQYYNLLIYHYHNIVNKSPTSSPTGSYNVEISILILPRNNKNFFCILNIFRFHANDYIVPH